MKTPIDVAQDKAHYLITNGYSEIPYDRLYRLILKKEIEKNESKEYKESGSAPDR